MIKAAGNSRQLELSFSDKPFAVVRANEMGLTVDGRSFTITRQGLFPLFQLWLGKELRASAEQVPFLTRYRVACRGYESELRCVGIAETKFAFFQAGEKVGSISTSWWNRYKEVLIDLPSSLPLELPAFMMWLILWNWNDTN